jgi:hypothetical protein
VGVRETAVNARVPDVAPRAVARENAERGDVAVDAGEGLGRATARRTTDAGARDRNRDANVAVVTQAIAYFRDIAE